MSLKFFLAFAVGAIARPYRVCYAHENNPQLLPYAINPNNSQVYFDISEETGNSFFMGKKHALIGRVKMELFDDTVPVTARNFRELCRGVRDTPRMVQSYAIRDAFSIESFQAL